jgi:hypothetical protein
VGRNDDWDVELMVGFLRVAIVSALALGSLLVTTSPASAGCKWVTETIERAGVLITQIVQECTTEQDGDWVPPLGDPESPEAVECFSQALKAEDDPFTDCPGGAKGGSGSAGITNSMVLSAIHRTYLPGARLVIQPPGGKTLVNFDTIFSTESDPFRRTVRLLGHEVVLKIWASSFRWQFGDGLALATDHPGRTYEHGLPMNSYITHQYTDADVTVHPSVDTTYSAEYSVDGGPFQPVIGTVTIEGDAAGLRVVEARPVLTGSR